MPNPYLLLAGLVFAIGLFGSGVSIGYKYKAGEYAKEATATLVAVAEAAKRDAEIESRAALDAALRAAAQRRLAAEQRLKLESALELEKAINSCTVGPVTYGVLNQSIRTANGAAPTAKSVDGSVRGAK